jgi:hypothetical protein
VDALSIDDHIDLSMMFDFRVGSYDFIEIHWLGIILDSGCDALRHYSLWMQSGHDVRTTMIRGALHQRSGSFPRIAWDPRISVRDSVTVGMEARASFFLHEIGSLEEQFVDELMKLLQHRRALLVGGFQETSYVSTLPNHAMSGGCFTSYKVVWDLDIISSFSLDQSMGHHIVMALLEDKQYLGREDLSCTHFLVPLFCSRRDFRGLSVKKRE